MPSIQQQKESNFVPDQMACIIYMLFSLTRLRAKTKIRNVLIRDMLFADDAAVVTHIQEELQSLHDGLQYDFGLTISLKKTNVLGRDTEAPQLGHYYRSLRIRCCLSGKNIPWFHHHWQPLLGRIDRQEDWEGCFNSRARLTARVWTSPN